MSVDIEPVSRLRAWWVQFRRDIGDRLKPVRQIDVRAWPFDQAPTELKHVSGLRGDETYLVLVKAANEPAIVATLVALTGRGVAPSRVQYLGETWECYVLHGQPNGEPPDQLIVW